MSVATFSSAQRTRSLVAVIAAALSVGIAVGAMVPLISLSLEADGYSNTLIGVNGAMFPIGLLVIGYWLPRILRFFGPLRAVYFGVGVTSASVLLSAGVGQLRRLVPVAVGSGRGGRCLLGHERDLDQHDGDGEDPGPGHGALYRRHGLRLCRRA